MKVLYVLGWGRGGSTLLGNLMAQTPQVVHPGELGTIWNLGLREDGRLCGCGEPVLACPFWLAVASEVLGPEWTSADVDRVEALRREHVRDRKIPQRVIASSATLHARGSGSGGEAVYAQTLERLYEALGSVGDATLVVDSSKSASIAAFLPIVPGIDLFYVNLVRDPRAVAYSFTKPKALPGGDMNARAGALDYTYPAGKVARLWVKRQLIAEAILRRQPPTRSVVVRYEDLVAAPQATVDRLRTLVGEPTAALPFIDGDTIDMAPTHTAGGNPSRVASGPTTIRIDDAWRTKMRPEDVRRVLQITAPLRGRYGYGSRKT